MNVKSHLVAVAVIALLAVGMFFLLHGRRSAEPQDICEVAEACDRLGLFWTTGAPSFPQPIKGYSSLTISTEPITDEQATRVINGAAPEQWQGKARAYCNQGVSFGTIDDHLRCIQWGNVTLIGDPDVVDRLVGQR